MLIILAILLPVVHSMTDSCHALDVAFGKPSNLTESVREQLERGLGNKTLDDIGGFAAYYVGIPNTSNPQSQFTAVCIAGAGLPSSPYCYNVTSAGVDGPFSGSPIEEDAFLSFYRICRDEPDFELKLTNATTTTQTQEDD